MSRDFMTRDEFEGLAEQVVDRLDTKGESVEAAIEAVIGAPATTPLGVAITAWIRGERVQAPEVQS